MVYCGRRVGWIKTKLSTEVGLGPGYIVLECNQLPLSKRAQPPIFGPCLLWANGWMYQDATWYWGRLRPRPYCVRWGPNPPERDTAASPLFGSCLLWPNGRQSQLMLSTCSAISPSLHHLFPEPRMQSHNSRLRSYEKFPRVYNPTNVSKQSQSSCFPFSPGNRQPRLHDTTNCQIEQRVDTGWMFVYTIQPIVQPVVKPVWRPVGQPVVSCIQTFNRLPIRLDNRFDNRLNACLHDAAGCSTGLTIGCIVYTGSYPGILSWYWLSAYCKNEQYRLAIQTQIFIDIIAA